MPFISIGRRDPYWDMEGRGVRRNRRMRNTFKVLVLLAAGILAVVVLRPMAIRAMATYPDLDAWLSAGVALVSDPFKVVGAILLGAAVATALAYWRRIRSRRAVRR